MSQARKVRGMASQRIVAEYLRAHGFPYAESTGAGRSGTDVTGTPGIDWEIKARAKLDLPALMRQLRDRSEAGVLGLGAVRLNGQGPAVIADWPCVVRLEDLTVLLRSAGYGDPIVRESADG